MQIEQLASILYEEYCREVGGIAFNGDPLPNWFKFRADQNKTKQSNAWMKVAEMALIQLT